MSKLPREVAREQTMPPAEFRVCTCVGFGSPMPPPNATRSDSLLTIKKELKKLCEGHGRRFVACAEDHGSSVCPGLFITGHCA
jgi:hypothetical protein